MSDTTTAAQPRSPAVFSSIEEFCKRKQVGRSFVYLEAKRGRLRFTKIGKNTRISLEDELAYDKLLTGTGAV